MTNNHSVIRALSALVLAVALFAFPLAAQQTTVPLGDRVTVETGTPAHPLPSHARVDLLAEGGGTPVHPVYYEARHPDPGCSDRLNIAIPDKVLHVRESGFDRFLIKLHLKKHHVFDAKTFNKWETSTCGKLFASGWTHNLRTSAGTTAQYNQMFGTTAAVATYIALTNSAITPAEADTTLTSEIVSNGLARALSTPTNASTTLSVPAAATASVVGTTGAVTYDYWIAAGNQGIFTTPSPVSNTITTANATLSTTNFVSVAFTGQLGAAAYQMYRTTSGTPPSGTATVLVGGSPACSTAGTVVSCTWLDVSNTLSSVTIPASNLTNFGKATLVFTWTATATQSAQAFGVFNAASSGTMWFEGTFTSVSLNNGDTFQLTESVYY